MHSVIPQQTIADQNLYVMLLFVLIVHSIITYLLFKFESFIENFFAIQETCTKSQATSLKNTAYTAMKTDFFFS